MYVSDPSNSAVVGNFTLSPGVGLVIDLRGNFLDREEVFGIINVSDTGILANQSLVTLRFG